jgi:cystathionine beta-lyase/cystathionine gamma-synthase
VHGVETAGESGQPVVPSIVQSSTFFYGGYPEERGDILYTRYGNNPNQVAVAGKVAAMEGMESALALGSGMAATAMSLLALLRNGDHVVASRFLYGATKRLLEEELPKRGIETTLVDPQSGREWRQGIRSTTRVLFLELPVNPTLRLFDPRPMASLAKEQGISLVVDATFASPFNLRPAELGADVVIHSATKYLGGHSDLIAGVVSGSLGFIEEVRDMLRLYGPALDPHAAWLLERGLRTLGARMEVHNRNALALAEWLEKQDGVESVVYPGLESHPEHRLAKEILDGFGGMLGVQLQGGDAAADAFCRALTLAMVAPSLGGVETLVSQPRFTSHRGLTIAELKAVGIPPGYVRVSVGIEDCDDLKADFANALEAAKRIAG